MYCADRASAVVCAYPDMSMGYLVFRCRQFRHRQHPAWAVCGAKTVYKLLAVETHCFMPVAIAVVLVAQADLPVLYREDAGMGDGDAMSK